MFKKRLIERFLAAFMLLVFAFSITPRKYLHDLVANHKDNSFYAADDTGTSVIHKAGINCHTESIVAESPFTNETALIAAHIARLFLDLKSSPTNDFISIPQLLASLRGPPSHI